MSNCKVEGCQLRVQTAGMCNRHYLRYRRHGDVHAVKLMSREGKCTVDFCENKRYAKGLCQEHYFWSKGACKISGCERPRSASHGLCMLHAQRLRNGGSTETIRPILKEGEKRTRHDGYIVMALNGERILEHIYLAEKALGKSLPPKAVVHHMNEDRADNHTPFNLVICPNQEYHFLLHKRAELQKQGKLK